MKWILFVGGLFYLVLPHIKQNPSDEFFLTCLIGATILIGLGSILHKIEKLKQ